MRGCQRCKRQLNTFNFFPILKIRHVHILHMYRGVLTHLLSIGDHSLYQHRYRHMRRDDGWNLRCPRQLLFRPAHVPGRYQPTLDVSMMSLYCPVNACGRVMRVPAFWLWTSPLGADDGTATVTNVRKEWKRCKWIHIVLCNPNIESFEKSINLAFQK